MALVVNTNTNSLIVQRSLTNSSQELSKSIERLSSGFRINKAADDAAGLSISEGLKAQGRGSTVALSNSQTGVNLLQTAEGDLSIIQDNLQRMRDLAVQGANGTNGTAERDAIREEIVQRTKEITRIANGSAFSKINLLNGSSTSLSLQIGANYDPKAVSLNSLTIGGALKSVTSTSLGINNTTGTFLTDAFSTCAKVASYLSKIDSAIATISTRRSTIGSYQNRIESTMKSLTIKIENMTASESRIRDTDIAKEAASMTKNQILQQASTTLLAQANQAPSVALSLI